MRPKGPSLLASGMVHATPDLASFDSSAEMPCTMRAPGPGKMKTGQAVQSSDSISPAPSPPKARPIPRNFVWRLGGGRRSSSSTTEAEIEERDMAVAVDVPALRVSFDPWGQQQREEENERCKGCTKISRARAAAAVTAVMPAKVAASPPAATKPHGQYSEFPMSSMSTRECQTIRRSPRQLSTWEGGAPSFMGGQSVTEPPTPFCNPPVIPLPLASLGRAFPSRSSWRP